MFFVYLGGVCPFIFQVPTKIWTSRRGSVFSSSLLPSSVLVPILPCKKFLCRAFTVGIRCKTCAAINALRAKLFALDGDRDTLVEPSFRIVSCDMLRSDRLVSAISDASVRILVSSTLLHLLNWLNDPPKSPFTCTIQTNVIFIQKKCYDFVFFLFFSMQFTCNLLPSKSGDRKGLPAKEGEGFWLHPLSECVGLMLETSRLSGRRETMIGLLGRCASSSLGFFRLIVLCARVITMPTLLGFLLGSSSFLMLFFWLSFELFGLEFSVSIVMIYCYLATWVSVI